VTANSLEVYHVDRLVFSSQGRWIYPLFELEEFLATGEHAPADLRVVDKIVGKAAAMVLVHLGIGRIEAGMASDLARDFLGRRSVPFSYEELVPRILCRTEGLLEQIDDVEQAYTMLRERARTARPEQEMEES
jgi:zinc transport system ATP-binding protein